MNTSALVRQFARTFSSIRKTQMGVLPAQQGAGQPLSLAPRAAMFTSVQEESWDRVLDVLSSLIKNIKRADGTTWRDAHANMPVYLKVCWNPTTAACRPFACLVLKRALVCSAAFGNAGYCPTAQCDPCSRNQREGEQLHL